MRKMVYWWIFDHDRQGNESIITCTDNLEKAMEFLKIYKKNLSREERENIEIMKIHSGRLEI